MLEKNDSLLFTALIQAMREIEQPKKNATNPHFKSKFADLGSCFDAVREPLLKFGIVISQLVDMDSGKPVLVTRLTHRSGEFIASAAPLPENQTPQQFGSAITYMRRYALCAMLGLVAEADDDGNAASNIGAPAGFVSKSKAASLAEQKASQEAKAAK